MKLISLFSGAGGLDLGFERMGFEIEYANEFDKSIVDTFFAQFKDTYLDTRSITNVKENELPDCVGIIGARHVKVGVRRAQ